MSMQTTEQSHYHHLDEQILVVPRAALFAHRPAWHGLAKIDVNHYLPIIEQHKQFRPRSLMETNPTYKQIIPYMIFKYRDSFFLMQRKAKASEVRLQGKYTLGIGGHIRSEDLQAGSTLFDWARREFHEEVDYRGSMTITLLGLLNDDTNPVGQVHIGLVLLLQGNSEAICVKDELESGALVSLETCKTYEDRLESWSQLIISHLT